MTIYSVIFYLLAAIIVAATAVAITRQNTVHAVVYLTVSFFGTALLFYLLGAPLLAALEVIIYAGAIMVLFLFIIMMLRVEERKPDRIFMRQWIVPGIPGAVALVVAGIMIFVDAESGLHLQTAVAQPAVFGRFLFENYWLPVEIVSLLLFVGLVGALYLGRHQSMSQSDRLKDQP